MISMYLVCDECNVADAGVHLCWPLRGDDKPIPLCSDCWDTYVAQVEMDDAYEDAMRDPYLHDRELFGEGE